jgi:DNA-binding NarL/FixJ family response regulator
MVLQRREGLAVEADTPALQDADILGVLVIDDHPIFRLGLRALLTQYGEEMALVGEASDGVEGLQLATRYAPAVVLLNAQVSGLDGMAAIRQLKHQVPSVSIIVMTSVEEEETLFYAIKYGAAAYVVKTVSADEMVRTIRRVAQGEYLINDSVLAKPVLASRVLKSFRDLAGSDQEAEPLYIPLSAREVEVLDYIAKGNSNKEIARALSISDQTVKNHITSIMRKLAVNDRTQAVVYALRQGWIKG